MFDVAANHPIASILLSPVATICAAIIAAGASIWSNIKTNRNTSAIQDYKSATDRELERLKAKLAHGQLINSTQWNAEFSAYQAIWKSAVPVRTLAYKIVMREGELVAIGLQPGDVAEPARLRLLQRLISQYAKAATVCLIAINENAPFYPADMRMKANEMHSLAGEVNRTSMAALVARQKQQSLPVNAEDERREYLRKLMQAMDTLEEMIRKRLNEVQIFNPALL